MKTPKIAFYLCLTVLVCAARVLRADTVATARVVAQVGEELLIDAEIKHHLQPLYRQLEEIYSGDELAEMKARARSNAVQSWVERELILKQARRAEDIFITPHEIESRLEEARSAYPSREEYEAALAREGLTESDLRSQIGDELKIQHLVVREVRQRVHVSPRQISDYYEANPEQFAEREMVRFSHILIRAGDDEESRSAARERAERIRRRLEEGDSFEDLARNYSEGPRAEQGGDWGFVVRGDLRPALEEAVFDLKVEEHSRLIETELGFHIGRVTARRAAELKPLDEVWEEIEDKLYAARFEEIFRDWIERLKAESYVVIFE